VITAMLVVMMAVEEVAGGADSSLGIVVAEEMAGGVRHGVGMTVKDLGRRVMRTATTGADVRTTIGGVLISPSGCPEWPQEKE